MLPKYSTALLKILRSVDTSKHLEKIAQDFKDDPEVFEKASQAKILIDAEVFEMVKSAGLASTLGRKALTGAAYGAGAGVPLALGGSYLLGRAGDEAEETTADIRNKVLQTALGLGGIGAGLYGLHRLTGGEPVDINQMAGIQRGGEKQAAHDENHVEELVEKLATVGMLDDMLNQVDNTSLSEEAQKLATEIRVLNRGYGVQLLYEASHR